MSDYDVEAVDRLPLPGRFHGGPEETDRNPPRLERYDRWGHDVSRVVMPTSFTESRRAS